MFPSLARRPGRTSEPEEVIDASEQLHSHVVVDQGVLQHPRLEAQVPHVFPHPPLAAFLVVPEIKQWGGSREGDKEELCKGTSSSCAKTPDFWLLSFTELISNQRWPPDVSHLNIYLYSARTHKHTVFLY